MSASTHRRLELAAGELSTAAVQRIEATHSWYGELPAQERSWVGVVAQAGIASFIAWHAQTISSASIAATVFGAAPRELTRSISLGQTLGLVRSVVTEVEDRVPTLAAPGDEIALREAVLTYSREIAFGVAQVYAGAAEIRGAWDARLESLVVDAVLRAEADEDLHSRASALGWDDVHDVVVVAGAVPRGRASDAVEDLRAAAAQHRHDALLAVHGGRLIAILGGVCDPLPDVTKLVDCWGVGPVVVGPRVPHLFATGRSARAALSGLDAAAAWPEAPRPCSAEELIAERALGGDHRARRQLVGKVRSAIRGRESVEQTLRAFLDAGSLEATARELFVHPNTVRYRLGKFAETSGFDVTVPRDAFAVRIALALSRLSDDARRL